MYRRVLLKISGEALSSTERPVCFEKIEKTALDVKKLHDAGIQVGIVTGGGNIMRGRDAAEQDRSRMDNMGMLATAINALALQDCLIRIGVPTVVMSAVAMNRFCEEFTARGAVQALETAKSCCSRPAPDARISPRTLPLRCALWKFRRTRCCLQRTSTRCTPPIRRRIRMPNGIRI